MRISTLLADPAVIHLNYIRPSSGLARSFISVVRERRVDELREWLISALRSELPEFVSFANGITEDLQAVRAALQYEWSNGHTEGQVNRLKMIKRMIYGRGKLDLLKARVLHDA